MEIDLKLSSVIADKRASFSIANHQNNNTILFLMDNTSINAFSINNKMEIDNKLSISRKKGKFKILLGSCFENDSYYLFFSEEAKKHFYVSAFDFKSRKSVGLELNFKVKKETYLESFSHKGKFYILTVINNSSKLKLYTFSNYTTYTEAEFDFSPYKFSDSDSHLLSSVLTKASNEIQEIDTQSPSTLDLTTSLFKLYTSDHELKLSLDNSTTNTKVISIDLDNNTSDIKYYPHWANSENNKYTSNSFIHNKHIYQIKGRKSIYTLKEKGEKNDLLISIKKLESGQLVKEYIFKEDKEIEFKNSPLRQKGRLLSTEVAKEISETTKFFAKISNSNVGISVYESEVLQITFGGFKDFNDDILPFLGRSMPMMNLNNSNYTDFNPTMANYTSFYGSRSIYFTGIYDNKTFEHKKGVLPDNAFDKIKRFTTSIKDRVSSETIFKIDGYYVLGYYNKVLKKYYLRKFEDG